MADQQVENIDPTKTEDVGSKLGKSLFEGFSKIKSGMLNPSPENKGAARDMINTLGRNFLSASFATSGAMGATNTGDPTQALIGQKMAQAVDQTLQKHWWIQKARDFQKEKLEPMKKKYSALQTGFNARSSDLQRKMYGINNQFGADKEEAIRATIEEKKVLMDQGKLSPEEFAKYEAEANAAITENENNRNNALGEVQAEYAAMVNDFNTAYSEQTLGLINDAAMYDQDNPILGQLINNTVGIISNEANSFTSKLSLGNEALGAVQANDQFEYSTATRATPAQRQRVNEATAVQTEEAAKQTQIATLEAKRDYEAYQGIDAKEAEGMPPVEQIMSHAARSIEAGRSPGSAIKNTLSDNNLRAATQAEWEDDVINMSNALGYTTVDKDGNPVINEDLTDENELNTLRGEFAEFAMALAATKGIPGNENKNLSELSDFIDETNVRENSGIPSAISILQKRLKKEEISVSPKEVSAALDEIQKNGPTNPEEMIADTLDLLRQGKVPSGKAKEKDKKGLFSEAVDAFSKKVTGLFDEGGKETPAPKSEPKTSTSETPASDTAATKPTATLLPSSKSTNITPERLVAEVKSADQGKVYGALLKRRGEIQTELQLIEQDPDKTSQVDAKKQEMKALEAFISYYQAHFPVKLFKEFHNIAHVFLQSGKASKTVLSKYGMADE